MASTGNTLLAVRAVTAFVVLDKGGAAAWMRPLSRAIEFIAKLAVRVRESGYEVQTLRIITNPFSEWIDTKELEVAINGLRELKDVLRRVEETHVAILAGTRIRFSIGAVTSLDDLKLVPALIREAGDLANTCLNVPVDEETGTVDAAIVLAGARVCAELGKTTPHGEGNFNFTINFNGPRLCPYFPAGFNTRESGMSFVLGLEYPNLLVSVLESLKEQSGQPSIVTSAVSQRDAWAIAAKAIREAVNEHLKVIVLIAREAQATQGDDGFVFAGIDSSPAPSKTTESMCRVVELLGVDHFGASGTVEVCAFLTRIFKSVGYDDVPLVGFSGLMFAVLEDKGLAAAAAKQQYHIGDLLTYSACCGIGLDTVPIPGDTSIEKMAKLARDCGTMAYRLNKPLTVRLFPIPGLCAGDMTSFESEDLCNCRVFDVH